MEFENLQLVTKKWLMKVISRVGGMIGLIHVSVYTVYFVYRILRMI